MMIRFTLIAAFAAAAFPARAQDAAASLLQTAESGITSGTVIQLFSLLTALAFIPAILVAATSFTRFIVVMSILRAGIGLQTTPANVILISLSMFLTFYVMSPVLEKSWTEGMQPLLEKKLTEAEAFPKIAEPFRTFMLSNVREKDLELFSDLASERGLTSAAGEKVSYQILVPAFMISELRRGFEIGFLIVLPFLIIDLVVATITMAMGMMMLPPTVIALPLKVLFFVLIDGWHMLAGSLVRSFS